MEKGNVIAHNSKFIYQDLRDKWILDKSATNHMTGKPNFWMISPASSDQSQPLGNIEKLMDNQIGSFKVH